MLIKLSILFGVGLLFIFAAHIVIGWVLPKSAAASVYVFFDAIGLLIIKLTIVSAAGFILYVFFTAPSKPH